MIKGKASMKMLQLQREANTPNYLLKTRFWSKRVEAGRYEKRKEDDRISRLGCSFQEIERVLGVAERRIDMCV
jgi:hypothetical protein